MGNTNGIESVTNRTPYKWTFCIKAKTLFIPEYTEEIHLNRYEQQGLIFTGAVPALQSFYLYVKYGHCSKDDCCKYPDLWYIFNPSDNPEFTIKESGDRYEILLTCNKHYEKKKSTCRNYGRLEDDAREEEERRKREQEEERQRQQIQRELEKKIEEQIKNESAISAQKLAQANEKLRQEQFLRGHEFHQQTHTMQQQMDIYDIDRDEEAEMEERFMDLMLEYQIMENENKGESLSYRMKTLQNEIMVEYCKKHGLSSSCVFFFDTAVAYEILSLTDRLSLLEAVLCIVFEESENDHTSKSDRDFLLCVLEQLHDTQPSLAWKLLQNYLYTDVQISMLSKEILCLMVLNNLWMPSEIIDFKKNISGLSKEQVDSVLQLAQTYKLQYCDVLSVLNDSDPVKCLQFSVQTERPKDAKTILREMRAANHPENVLTVLEDLLVYLEQELPKHQEANLSKDEIQCMKEMVKVLDFKQPDQLNNLQKILITMSVAVKVCTAITVCGKTIKGYFPRLTQLATLVTFLMPNSTTKTGCLFEIGTGEGKSCILAMLAAIHAMRGVKVDLVTSSPVLAYRDLEEWKGLYDMFGITSSVVPAPLNDSPPEKQDELNEDAYKHQIIYSTVGTFAADILKQEFERKTTRGDREFELVIVDEVDYMTLDNGVQITFLSHESGGLQHLEQVLASIWVMAAACRPVKMEDSDELMWAMRVQNFHTAALQAVIGLETSDKFSPLEVLLPGIELGFYSEEDFEMLKQSMCADDDEKKDMTLQNDAWENLMSKTGIEQQYDLLTVIEIAMEHKVAFNCHMYQSDINRVTLFGEQKKKTDLNINILLLEKGKACELMSEDLLVEAIVSKIKSKVKYSNECSQNTEAGTDSLVIPTFLKEYLEKQLPVFVENALKAIQMTKGREYMIERSLRAQGLDISEEDQHLYHSIIPVDFQATGMLEKRKRWGDGLQQFLEMKHQLALSPLSNVTNYMSNLSFFQRYLNGKGIFGVSGTLGGDADKAFLARHYKTDSYVIPAHQRKKVTELPAIQIRGGIEKWIQRLCDTVSEASNRGQVVLVVCEDVNTSNALKEKLPVSTMYTMSESHNIENHVFDKGEIIITTNLGGRGTDIKVKNEVNSCGGLFVILTYFPNNRRVEQQIFGRTGRKGTPGMVQLILNHDHLPVAYQGQSVEAMREVREKLETDHVRDMEKEKLTEIQMKEELFFTFCTFLTEFDKNYRREEKTDLFEVKVKDVPCYFESFSEKIDYHPALNALKESWGMWLVLHTDQITTQSDISQLKQDLIKHLQNESDKLLHGNSTHFYDLLQQALGRTALHFQNKNKSDYGAKLCWEKVADLHKYYRAVALYNQAYITINMAKKNYKNDARSLLEEAEKAIDAYVSETANILSLCSMSVSKDFEPHHHECCNFHTQMQARMNIFNSWKSNITDILTVLTSSEDVITVDSTLYNLSTGQDFVSTSELSLLRSYGLAVVFNVKQKPRFSFDALICCFLGLAQVVGGVLIGALSCGSMASFGLGLISEGVSDMISGVMGMINGSFSWASWAISKAISIGISLAFCGLKSLKGAYSSVKEAASGIRNGTKSLKNVACDAIRSGKQVFKSASQSAKSMASSIGSASSIFTKNAAKINLNNAAKFVFQEIAFQTGNAVINTCIDAAIQKGFKSAFQNHFQSTVCSALKENKKFISKLTDLIASRIPITALDKRYDYKIDINLEKNIKDHIILQIDPIVNNLVVNCKEAHLMINALSQVWDKAAEYVTPKYTETYSLIRQGVKITSYVPGICEAFSSVPTKSTIDNKFVPAFLQSLDKESLFEPYDKDGRDKLKEVERLRNEIIDLVSETISQIMIQAFAGSATSLVTKTFSQKLNSQTGKVIANLVGRHGTQSFVSNQQHSNNLQSSDESKRIVSEETSLVSQYAEKICDEEQPATDLVIYVLTRSDLLKGKGVSVTVVDSEGKFLKKQTYPGTDPRAGYITLLLTKTPLNPPSLKSSIGDKDIPHSGHFDIIRPDGSIEKVNSEHQNCLFHAVIQATTNEPDSVVKKMAKELRSKVCQEILSNPCKYADAVKIQNMFDKTNSCNKFKIEGGYRPGDDEDFKNKTKDKTPDEIIKDYKLGEVDTHEKLCETKVSPVVEADHIPPKIVFSVIRRSNKNILKKLKQNNRALHDFLMDNNMNEGQMICMNTLVCDHRNVLTTGRSAESCASRELLWKIWMSGDNEKALKYSLLVAHPEFSENFRRSLGKDPVPALKDFPCLPKEARRSYYHDGFLKVVKIYHEKGIITDEQSKNLNTWINSWDDSSFSTQKNIELTTALKDIINTRPKRKTEEKK